MQKYVLHLIQPGVDIKEGDYILAVNGIPLTTAQEPYAAFQGLSDKTVEITYNTNAIIDRRKNSDRKNHG